MAGLSVEKLFPFIILCKRLKINKLEVYWLTDFPLINDWACAKKELKNFHFKWCAQTIKEEQTIIRKN